METEAKTMQEAVDGTSDIRDYALKKRARNLKGSTMKNAAMESSDHRDYGEKEAVLAWKNVKVVSG
eukprot:CAMPEP_0168760346 /NCGR_PEP_ID=MMETSP0724-20121128/22711_1 /TAXON_ID=265536 /ORGANISM="Amphiprora sp., Strain CCMP467" /LENGTH=65 /DNA_ID=CAMNT_0008809337 /DNA_START=23 /DNA_END=217 /DNA_ORIENTATION=+